MENKIKLFSAGQYVALSLKVRSILVPLVGETEARAAVVRTVRNIRADAYWKAYLATLPAQPVSTLSR